MKKSIIKLKREYEDACNAYALEFSDKQDMDFNGWIGNEIGGLAEFADMFFSMPDIVWDINSKQPKGLIIDWYNDNIDNPIKSINYFSYTKGLRIKDIK